VEDVTEVLYRGEHKLPHMSQVLGRDLNAEELARYPGARAMGWTLTDEQVEERRLGIDRSGLPYRFLVWSPSSCSLAWTAFYEKAELRAFCDAYGIAIEGELTPGSRFHLRLPDDDSRALPLERRQT
jgi:hypothetical protein